MLLMVEYKPVMRAIIEDNEGRVLLVKRPPGSTAEGLFHLVGGKPNQGETEIETVKREVREELGIEIDPLFS
jgi:8-oxo-dGTP diphosphatase